MGDPASRPAIRVYPEPVSGDPGRA